MKALKTALKWSAAMFSFVLTLFSMSEAIKEKKVIENQMKKNEAK